MTQSLTLTRIAAHLFNTPLLLLPETAVAIASGLAERFDVEPMDAALDPAVIEASRFRGRPAGRRDDGRDMYRAEKGIAIIGVMGELVNRGAWIGASSGLTSYEGLDAQLRQAGADPNIRGILLDINSPGGEATGAMETGALVRSIAAGKPVVAFVNGQAASAAYAIASGATHIVVPPSGLVGSIGVVFLHLDRSAALAKSGVKPTLIFAGAHKTDSTSLAELQPDAKARIQAHVDDMYGLFVKTVADHRKLSQKAVRATEGGMLMGRAAVDAGLADAIGGFDDAMALFEPKSSQGAFAMNDTVPKADHDAAVAKAAAEAATLAAQTAMAAERKRTGAILGAKEAEGRAKLAHHLAFATDMSVEAALATLAAAPVEAQGPGNRLQVPNPDVHPDRDSVDANAAANWGPIVADLNKRAAATPGFRLN